MLDLHNSPAFFFCCCYIFTFKMEKALFIQRIKFIIILLIVLSTCEKYKMKNLREDSGYLRDSSNCSGPTLKEMTSSEEKKSPALELCDEFFDWRLKTKPEFASMVGIHDYDDRLDSWSLESINKELQDVQEFLGKVETLLKTKLDEDDKLNLLILKAELELFIKGSAFKGYVCPINFLEGVQVEFDLMISWMVFTCEADYHKLLSRFRAFPTQAEEIISIMRLGKSEKRVPHMKSMEGVLQQFASLQVSAQESVFYSKFKSMPDGIPLDKQQELQKEGADVIENILLPAFKKIANFIDKEYIPALRPNIAATSLPDGENYYKQCLKYHLSLEMTPEEVHQRGLNEVKRIKANMEKIKEEVGFKGTLIEFFDHLRKEKQFYYTKAEDVINDYRDLEFNKIKPILPNYFARVSNMTLRIEEVPSAKGKAPSAYYMPGSWDGSRPGIFYVNTNFLDQRPKYDMASLALHEGLPGHHFQISYSIEQKGLPSFRRFLEDRYYSSMPSHFGLNTAYVEGWGLYSEFLGEEMKIYTDSYSLFGRYSMEIFRACRLVVDTGMHALGWSFDEAVSFMLNNSAASETDAKVEVARYITWPGQALAYKIGEMKLKELRKLSEEKLGQKFDVREFHDVIMQNGATSLEILEKRVKDYIHKTKGEVSRSNGFYAWSYEVILFQVIFVVLHRNINKFFVLF